MSQPSLLQCLVITACGSLFRACHGAAPPLLTEPAFAQVTPHLGVPPFLEDRLIYYRSFEAVQAEVRAEGIEERGQVATGPGGIRGRCAVADKPQGLVLHGAAFSPHRPLTVSFWWALQDEPTIETCFGLLHLAGVRGFVSHFSRGKGTWCALQRPAAILQVYSFPGIQNVNGIYDGDWAAHLELKAGVWHHAALVFHGASLVEVYTDGQPAWSVRVRGRPFAEADQLHSLVLGSQGGVRIALDEVLVLGRALTADEILTYVTALRQMRDVRYP